MKGVTIVNFWTHLWFYEGRHYREIFGFMSCLVKGVTTANCGFMKAVTAVNFGIIFGFMGGVIIVKRQYTGNFVTDLTPSRNSFLIRSHLKYLPDERIRLVNR